MITLNSLYVVVLDACVLAPMPLCDTILRLAEEPAFFAPRWSQHILDEVARYLRKKKKPYTEAQISHRVNRMNTMFEEALVEDYEALIPCMEGMEQDPNDKHVLAAAVRCGADAIVTFNLKDFPTRALARYGVELMSPDDFLVHQYHLDPEAVMDKLKEQASVVRYDLKQLLEKLEKVAPAFAVLAAKPL